MRNDYLKSELSKPLLIKEYFSRGVRLATGWRINAINPDLILVPGLKLSWPVYQLDSDDNVASPVLAALADQLVKQVEELGMMVHQYNGLVLVIRREKRNDVYYGSCEGFGRAINTIIAIVDSEFLEKSDE